MSGRLKDYGFESEMYDHTIVQVVRDVSRQLGFESNIVQVLWMDWEARFGRMDSDECNFHGQAVLLPKRMRGALEPEEWKPIIASRLIYRKRLRRSQPWGEGLGILLGPLLVIIGGAILYRLFGPEGIGIASLIYFVLVVGPILTNLFTQAHKKLRLQADLEATRPVGKETFLLVLRKIDGLRLKDIETTKERRVTRHLSSKPSISERIENLSRL